MKQHHVAIIAAEHDRTAAFYEALGFHIITEVDRPQKHDRRIWMTDGDTTLEIFIEPNAPKRPTEPEALGLRHIAFRPDDLDRVIAQLQHSGYEPAPIRLDSMTGERMTFVKDPDGLPIELHE